ncbi:MAG TPA: hypothetical protein VFW44_22165 [Bryobacteraceae bacterium]|nr:hypothetical protein [Bryobacteraceae bacterium]
MNLIPYVAIWAVIGIAVLALALYRKILTFHGDDEFVHLAEGEQGLIAHQVALGHRLAVIDGWGKTLTVITAVYGLAIVGVVLFQAWQASLQLK